MLETILATLHNLFKSSMQPYLFLPIERLLNWTDFIWVGYWQHDCNKLVSCVISILVRARKWSSNNRNSPLVWFPEQFHHWWLRSLDRNSRFIPLSRKLSWVTWCYRLRAKSRVITLTMVEWNQSLEFCKREYIKWYTRLGKNMQNATVDSWINCINRWKCNIIFRKSFLSYVCNIDVHRMCAAVLYLSHRED